MVRWFGVLAVLLAFVVFPALVRAVPSPWGIAINEYSYQCKSYWAGDENVRYPLDLGWTDYYYEPAGYKIETPYGTCLYKEQTDTDYISCCRKLGFQVVTKETLKYKKSAIIVNGRPSTCVLGNVIGSWYGISINSKTNECTGGDIGFNVLYRTQNGVAQDLLKDNSLCLEDPNWKRYTPLNISKITTPYGSCENLGFEDCCKKLGFGGSKLIFRSISLLRKYLPEIMLGCLVIGVICYIRKSARGKKELK